MFKPHETVCLQFFYHMYGNDIGSLAVYKTASKENRTLEKLLWIQSGQVDLYWHKTLVNVSHEEEFMVRMC